ncbi:uncharacterized protein LOC107811925 isoform X1 [Nicotiana tabacum]|uniref:Formin-F-like n=1 Tax=Nicotiana tabacum TaxID=4097 RepID=A0A1S4BU39_TOBAC|nr:formin-F-like [Nicotiana tomentosiformis]XP_016492401.1 PREDICTED: formin-F-like [Nicotiana tabacum]
MDSKKNNSPRKRLRKYHTRKAPFISSYIDMAEARREIVHALQLHRSSSSSPTPSINNPKKYTLLGQRAVSSQQYYYYSIVESMPIPEPTWSTTAPAILTTLPPLPPPPPPPLPFSSGEVPEFEWWIGFLKSLDCKKSASNGEVVIEKYFPLEENVLMENPKAGFGQLEHGLNSESPNCIDKNDDPNYQFPDEWLIIPTADDDYVLEL